MSLLEIIGESANPGPIGRISRKREPDSPKNKNLLFHFLIAVTSLFIVEYTYLDTNKGTQMNIDFWIFNGILLAYLLIGYYITIIPNTSNLGWVPFVIDNPFRFSDDINRFSILMMLLLMPGKYVLGSLINYYRHLKTK